MYSKREGSSAKVLSYQKCFELMCCLVGASFQRLKACKTTLSFLEVKLILTLCDPLYEFFIIIHCTGKKSTLRNLKLQCYGLLTFFLPYMCYVWGCGLPYAIRNIAFATFPWFNNLNLSMRPAEADVIKIQHFSGCITNTGKTYTSSGLFVYMRWMTFSFYRVCLKIEIFAHNFFIVTLFFVTPCKSKWSHYANNTYANMLL